MGISRYFIERIIRFRVHGCDKINSISPSFGILNVFVGLADGTATPDMIRDATIAIEEIRPAGFWVEVFSYNDGPGDSVSPAILPDSVKRGAWIGTITGEVLREFITYHVPECVGIRSSVVNAGEEIVYIRTNDGPANDEIIARVEHLLNEIFPPDLNMTVIVKPDTASPPAHKRSPTVISPRFDNSLYTDSSISKIAREDEDRLLDYISSLIEGRSTYIDFLGDTLPDGSRVFTSFDISNNDLALLLATHPRIFLSVQGERDKCTTNDGRTIDDIIPLARTKRIVPVFLQPLHMYEASVVRKIIDNDIRFVLPRQVHGLSTLSMANQFQFWRIFRDDPSVSSEAFYIIKSTLPQITDGMPNSDAINLITMDLMNSHIHVAAQGEQLFLDRGNLAISDMASGGLLGALSRHRNTLPPEIKKFFDAIFIEHMYYSLGLAISRGLGAIYFPGGTYNETVLDIAARTQAIPTEKLVIDDIRKTEIVLRELSLCLPRHLNIGEYANALNSNEAERLRAIISGFIENGSGAEDELISAAKKLNDEIRKLSNSNSVWLYSKLNIFGLGTSLAHVPHATPVKIALNHLSKPIMETPLGELEDRLIAKMGGVSPAAVRVKRIRTSLGTQ